MKLEYLCKLEEWQEKVSEIIDDMVTYAISEEVRNELRNAGEKVCDVLDISGIKAEIKKIEKEIDSRFGFQKMIYYEVEANLLESPRPDEVINLYKNRFRIIKNIFDEEEIRDIQSYIKEGRLSDSEAEQIERLYLMLTQCWEVFMEGIQIDIDLALSGFWREEKDEEGVRIIKESKLKKILNDHEDEEQPYITDKEQAVFSKLPEYFKFTNGKYEYIAKNGHGYKWEELATIIEIIHGNDFRIHEKRLKAYFGASWKRNKKEPKDGKGATRAYNTQERIRKRVNQVCN